MKCTLSTVKTRVAVWGSSITISGDRRSWSSWGSRIVDRDWLVFLWGSKIVDRDRLVFGRSSSGEHDGVVGLGRKRSKQLKKLPFLPFFFVPKGNHFLRHSLLVTSILFNSNKKRISPFFKTKLFCALRFFFVLQNNSKEQNGSWCIKKSRETSFVFFQGFFFNALKKGLLEKKRIKI